MLTNSHMPKLLCFVSEANKIPYKKQPTKQPATNSAYTLFFKFCATRSDNVKQGESNVARTPCTFSRALIFDFSLV